VPDDTRRYTISAAASYLDILPQGEPAHIEHGD